jgi:CRISPR-associated protein Csb1
VALLKQVKGKDVFYDPIKQAGEVPDAGKPSAANHGNVTPDLVRYADSVEALGIKKNDVAAGGVTIAHAEHTAVISLPQLRRLHFPIASPSESSTQLNVDIAARALLTSLALVGLTLAAERGFDLRSRCLLFPQEAMRFELLEVPGSPNSFTLTSEAAIQIFTAAVDAATKAGLPWETAPVKLTPSPQLIELVKRSQMLATTDSDGGDE